MDGKSESIDGAKGGCHVLEVVAVATSPTIAGCSGVVAKRNVMAVVVVVVVVVVVCDVVVVVM